MYNYHGCEGSFDPLDIHRFLEGAYTEYQRCHKEASSAESVDLQNDFFYNLENINPNRDPNYLLPAVGPFVSPQIQGEANLNLDRKYRKAAKLQQESSAIARTWYNVELPVGSFHLDCGTTLICP